MKRFSPHPFLTTCLLAVTAALADVPPTLTQLDVADQPLSALCLSGDRIAVGQPDTAVNGLLNAGLVRWHHADTGKLLRTFVSPTPTDSQRFGAAVAVASDRLLIGAPGTNQVFVFSTRNGALLATLSNASERFGETIVTTAGFALIGAPGHDFGRGAVYAVDLHAEAAPVLMFAADGAIDDELGSAIAVSGGLLLAGSPGDEADTGSAYLFDWTTGTEISKLIATDGAPSHRYGVSVALRGNRAFVGAPGAQLEQGAVYEVEAPSSLELRLYTSPTGSTKDAFGTSLSLWGGLLAVGAPGAGSQGQGQVSFFNVHDGTARGTLERSDIPGPCATGTLVALNRERLAVYSPFPAVGEVNLSVYRGLVGPLGGRIEASQNYPLQTANSRVGAPIQAVLDSLGFGLATTGFTPEKGSGLGKVILLGGDPLALAEAARFSTFLSARITGFPLLFANQNSYQMYSMALAGQGVNAGNNFYLVSTSGFDFRTGTAVDGLGAALVSRAYQVRQASDTLEKQWGMLFGLKRQASSGVTASNDTGIRVADELNQATVIVREGDLAPLVALEDPADPVTYGEMVKRFALNPDAVFAAALVGGPSGTRQGVFRHTIPGIHERVARQGNEAEGTSGATFSTFTGETASSTGWTLFRATLKGPGLSAQNNEGLWRKLPTFTRELVARKGDAVPEIAGARWNRFLGYWAIGNQVLVYARIAGPGITAKTDTVLMLLQENGHWKLLLREGLAAPGCPDATIGIIDRIEVDTNSGRYAVITRLAASAAENQAVYVGATLAGNAFTTSGERLPHLLMRKGTPHQAPFATLLGKVKSLRLPGPPADASGAGGIGLSSAINLSGTLFLDVDYGKNNRHLLRTHLP